MKKEIRLRLLSRNKIIVTLSRRNLLYVMSLLRFEQHGVLSILEITDVTASILLSNGMIAKIPLLRFTLNLLRLVENHRIEVVSVEDRCATVRVKEFNFSLYGPIDLLSAAVYDMFSDFYYYEIDVAGKVVVDIGGFIGDTALYFASRGAKAVYVFEPSSELVKYARRNVAQSENIFLNDYGLGSEDKTDFFFGYFGYSAGEEIRIREISSVLAEILKREGKIDLLKVDCEGCEWELLTCIERPLFDVVSAVYVEIHGGDHNALLSRLENFGFRLKKSKQIPLSKSVSMYLLDRLSA